MKCTVAVGLEIVPSYPCQVFVTARNQTVHPAGRTGAGGWLHSFLPCSPVAWLPPWLGSTLSGRAALGPTGDTVLLVLLSLQGSRRSSPGPHWTQAAGFHCVDGFVLTWVTWQGLPSAHVLHPSRFVPCRPWRGLQSRVACLAAYVLFIFHLPRPQPSRGQAFGASGVPMCLSCQAHNRHSVSTKGTHG